MKKTEQWRFISEKQKILGGGYGLFFWRHCRMPFSDHWQRHIFSLKNCQRIVYLSHRFLFFFKFRHERSFCYEKTINRDAYILFQGNLLPVFSITAILQTNKCVPPPNFISFLIISKSPSVLHHPPSYPCCQQWVGKDQRASSEKISFACNPTGFCTESSGGKTGTCIKY